VATLGVGLVTCGLAWLTWHWTRLARRPPGGMGVYARAVARSSLIALLLWCAGVIVVAAGSWLLPAAPSAGAGVRLTPPPGPVLVGEGGGHLMAMLSKDAGHDEGPEHGDHHHQTEDGPGPESVGRKAAESQGDGSRHLTSHIHG